ncbi:MAG: formyltransferase family protein [Planctomycetota bacterium]
MSTDPRKATQRVGVISCSGGATFVEAVLALQPIAQQLPGFHVVTDRPCGIEDRCTELNVGLTRIEDDNIDRFCAQAADVLIEEHRVGMVLLFFHRIVTKSLWGRVPTLNIHPSLLPAYRGFSPLKRALADGVKEFGATLHLATDAVDAGPILAQVKQQVPPCATLDDLNRMSFIQKTCLTLLAIEALMTDRLQVDLEQGIAQLLPPVDQGLSMAPSFATKAYRDAFARVQAVHDIPGQPIQL